MIRNTVLAIGLIALAGLAHAEPSTTWKESVAPNEAEAFKGFAQEINKLQDSVAADTGKVDRGFHAKTHTVLKAELRVTDTLPEPLRQGAFAKATTYKTWVRLSNGQGVRQSDRKPDVRGFALKILDVPGESLTAGRHSLDLLCINHAAQPARDITQFMAFVRVAGNLVTAPFKLSQAVGFKEATRMLTWLATHAGKRVHSMATTDFYTAVPLAFGKYAVKVRIKPNNPASQANTSDENYLRSDLVARLAKGDLKFDVMVQFFTDETNTPIEDASVEWNSPWMKAGELVISQRDLNSAASKADEEQGNQLLWNPWNAPAEHRPLGSLMRARRVVYPASGQHRGATQE